MSENDIAFLAKEIAHDAGVEIDLEGSEKVRAIIARAGAKWKEETMRILIEKNQTLLDKLFALETHLDSLLLIANKPAILKKEFKSKLEEYEKTIEMCAEYADRHLNQ